MEISDIGVSDICKGRILSYLCNWFISASVNPNQSVATGTPKSKKRRLSGSSTAETNEPAPSAQSESDAESESSVVTPRTTRSKAKESPVLESKPVEKNNVAGTAKNKNKDVGQNLTSAIEDSEKTEKVPKGKSVSKDKDEVFESSEINERYRAKGSKDTFSESEDITEKTKGKTKAKTGKAGRPGKAKSKNKSSPKGENYSVSLPTDWADKRPTPSMDYNESNAKCPLPGCDSKG